MSDSTIAQDLAHALRNVHRGVLVTLAVCAAVVMTQPVRENAVPPPQLSTAAIEIPSENSCFVPIPTIG